MGTKEAQLRLCKDIPKKGNPFLRWQALIVVATFAAVAVVVFLGNQHNREARKMAIEQFNKQQLILARTAASGIETYFNGVESELAVMAKTPGVKQMAPECLESLEHAYSVFPQKTSIRLLNSNGVLRFIYPDDGWRKELTGIGYSEERFLGLNTSAARAVKDPDLSYEVIDRIQKKMLAGEEGVGRYISGWHREQKGEIEKLVAYAPVHVSGKLWSVAVCAPITEVEEIELMVRNSAHYTLAFIILLLTTGGFLFFIISFRRR